MDNFDTIQTNKQLFSLHKEFEEKGFIEFLKLTSDNREYVLETSSMEKDAEIELIFQFLYLSLICGAPPRGVSLVTHAWKKKAGIPQFLS